MMKLLILEEDDLTGDSVRGHPSVVGQFDYVLQVHKSMYKVLKSRDDRFTPGAFIAIHQLGVVQ